MHFNFTEQDVVTNHTLRYEYRVSSIINTSTEWTHMKDRLKAKNRESVKAETDKDMITDSAVTCSDQRVYNKVVKSFLFS